MPLATVVSWLLVVMAINLFLYKGQPVQFSVIEFAEGVAATLLISIVYVIPIVLFMSLIGPGIWTFCSDVLVGNSVGRAASAQIATFLTVLSAGAFFTLGFALLFFLFTGGILNGVSSFVLFLAIIIPGIIVGIPFTVVGLRIVK
jgi:hypothetical protein